MRIITLNANGIRSAERKGFFTWMQQQNADIICIQETNASWINLALILFSLQIIIVFTMTLKKGYSGVALYCKKEPDRIINGIGWQEIDTEGRFIEA